MARHFCLTCAAAISSAAAFTAATSSLACAARAFSLSVVSSTLSISVSKSSGSFDMLSITSQSLENAGRWKLC